MKRAEIVQALEGSVNQLRNEMIAVLQKLVSIPSVTGDEGKAQEFMRQNYEALGLDVRVLYANRAAVYPIPRSVTPGSHLRAVPTSLEF